MRYLNIFLVVVLLFSFISPALGNSADWYMVQEAYSIAQGRKWFIAQMEGLGKYLFVGSKQTNGYDFYFYNKSGHGWYGKILYGRNNGDSFSSTSVYEYKWDGSGWVSSSIPEQYENWYENNHKVLYSNVDIVYWPDTSQVFFSKMLPLKPLNLGEIMEEAPILQVMTEVGGMVSGEALKIFGIVLGILLGVYLVRSLPRFKV